MPAYSFQNLSTYFSTSNLMLTSTLSDFGIEQIPLTRLSYNDMTFIIKCKNPFQLIIDRWLICANNVFEYMRNQVSSSYLLFSFFFPKTTLSISYKILQMRVLYTNPCRDMIVPSYVKPH